MVYLFECPQIRILKNPEDRIQFLRIFFCAPQNLPIVELHQFLIFFNKHFLSMFLKMVFFKKRNRFFLINILNNFF